MRASNVSCNDVSLDISGGCSSSGTGKIDYLTLVRAIVITTLSAAACAGTILPTPDAFGRCNKGQGAAWKFSQ